MEEFNYNQKFKKCLVCGAFVVFLAEPYLCHECAEKLDANPHSIEENRFVNSQLLNSAVSLSAAPASGVVSKLDDLNFTID